jgi:NodT family efflux transporter outer membrane factor (OMF) lipoprotein
MLDAAEADVDDARVLLAAEVAGAYFRLRGEQDRLAVAQRNAANQRRTLDVTLDRLEGGQGTGLDTERARAQLSSTLATISGLEASAAAQRNRVEALVGRDVGPLLEGAAADADAALSALPALPDEVAVPETDNLVRQRADLRGAARRVAASEAFAGAARSAYLPRIYIQGAAGYTAGAFDALGSSGTPRYAVGPVVSWPLLDLGRVKAQADGAQARQAEARAGYQGAVLRAIEEVETSRVAYERARERLQHLEAAAAASERATELARLRFDEGATGFLEVLDAERRQLEAQDRLAVGRTEAAQTAVALYRALGGRWPGS